MVQFQYHAQNVSMGTHEHTRTHTPCSTCLRMCRLNYIGTLLFFTKLLLVSGVGAGGVDSGGRLNAFNHLERKI